MLGTIPPVAMEPEYYGAVGKYVKDLSDKWHYREDSNFAYGLTWQFFQPKSRHYRNNEALCRAILVIDSICRGFKSGDLLQQLGADPNINRFAICPVAEAIRILLKQPISPKRKAFWRKKVREAADYQIATYGQAKIPIDGYPNQDVMYLLLMRLAHQILGDAKYAEACDHALKMLKSQLRPDGAFYYLYPHNEVPVYHGINIAYIFRDWILSGDQRSRELIVATIPYFPMMYTNGGWMELSSDAWWKRNGSMRYPCWGPAIVAGVTGDGKNQFIANKRLKKPGSMRHSFSGIFISYLVIFFLFKVQRIFSPWQ